MTKKQQKHAHPGTVLRKKMEAKSFSQAHLANALGISGAFLSDILNENRGLSAKLALRLEEVFGVKARVWMDFQTDYELEKAREAVKGR